MPTRNTGNVQFQQQATKLGPFVGGINNITDPAFISDTELVECVNFEVDLDGSLISRPQLDLMGALDPDDLADFLASFHTHAEGNFQAICVFIYEDVPLLIFSDDVNTYFLEQNEDGTNFNVDLAFTGPTQAAVQYDDRLWAFAVPGSGDSSGWWTPDDGFNTIANMGEAAACVVYKDRLFAVPGISSESDNSERLHFSTVGDPETWSASDFIDVGVGDGQNLVDVVVYQDNLLLFKESSTYVFAYDSAPSSGVLRQVHPNIGASAQRCVAVYENSAYVLHQGYVWEITNYNFTRINLKCKFEYTRSIERLLNGDFNPPIFLSIIGERLLVRFYDRMYVYGIRTKSWSLWETLEDSVQALGYLIRIPDSATYGTTPRYIAGSCISSLSSTTFYIDDIPNRGNNFDEGLSAIYCRIKTKDYDYGNSHKFKRLWWWGCELVGYDSILGTVTVVVREDYSTWGECSAFEWGDLSENQWRSPLQVSPVYTTIADADNITRTFVKFPHGLRFRRVNYEVELNTFATDATGPVRIFSLTTLADSQRQTVPEELN